MRCAASPHSSQDLGAEVPGAERADHDAVGLGRQRGARERAVVARGGRHDQHGAVEVGRVQRRVARQPAPDRRVALGDAAERAVLRAAERDEARRVGLAHRARVMDLAAEDDQDAEPAGGRRGGDADRVDEVGGPVGAGRGRRADRAGEDDRRLGVVQDVAQHRRLLERVGAVRHDDADAAAARVARRAADRELVGRREVRAGLVHQRARLEALELRRARWSSRRSRPRRAPGWAPPLPTIPIVPPAERTRTRRAWPARSDAAAHHASSVSRSEPGSISSGSRHSTALRVSAASRARGACSVLLSSRRSSA